MDLLSLLPLFLLAYAVLVLLMTVSVYRALRRPPRCTFAAALARGLATEPQELGLVGELLSLHDAQGRATVAWSIAGGDPEGPLVVLIHGFGRSRYSSLQVVPQVIGAASRVVLPDLPGHGDSAAPVCTAGVTEWRDVLAFVEQVRIDDRPVVLYGRSMGAGVCIAAAACSGGLIAGLIGEGAYRDWAGPVRRRIRRSRYPAEPMVTLVGLFCRLIIAGLGDFDRVKLAGRLTCPLLLLHGGNDAICPVDDARAIAAAGRGELVVFEGGEHLNLHEVDPARHRDAIGRFLAALPRWRPAAPKEQTSCLTHP